MDSLSHLKAILYRNSIWAYRSPFRLADVVVWPLVLLFTLSLFLSVVEGNPEYMGLLILAVIGWKAIYFSCFETTAICIEEHWHKSLTDLLVSPISNFEIAIGGLITGIIKTLIVVVLGLSVGYFIYDFFPTQLPIFFIAVGFLVLAGLSISLILFGFSCYFDKRNVFTLSFLIPELLALVSGPYYDLKDVFPNWFVSIMNFFPTTHAFNMIKSIFGFAEVDYIMLIATSVLWLIISLFIYNFFYTLGRKKGTLTKLG